MGRTAWPRKLKAWRKGEGLTQAKAAERLGVSQACYCDWENGKKAPTHPHAIKIEGETGVSVMPGGSA